MFNFPKQLESELEASKREQVVIGSTLEAVQGRLESLAIDHTNLQARGQGMETQNAALLEKVRFLYLALVCPSATVYNYWNMFVLPRF